MLDIHILIEPLLPELVVDYCVSFFFSCVDTVEHPNLQIVKDRDN